MAKKAKKTKEYRALVGMDFLGEDGEPHRVEAGDKIEGMPENELRRQVNEKNAEVWKRNQTDNVRDNSGAQVYGVRSRHSDGEIYLHGVEESEG